VSGLLSFIYQLVTGSSSLQEPAQLTSSKFNGFLEKGQVIVYNKTEAEVF
jgi:cell division protease FtsH